MSLVKVKNLTISFKQYDNIVHAVRGISFEINQGESLGIVGESGSGKSVTFMTVMGLMNSPTSIVEADLIEIDGINVLDKSKENIKKIEETDIDKLIPVEYNFKNNPRKRFGFIAQDVEEDIDNLVYTDDKGMKGINYQDIISLLVKENQDLKRRIENLEKKHAK